MHLGNARTALLAWLAVRRARGTMVLRLEDLDRARIAPGAEQRLLDDLAWLGLDWDEGPYRQSQRRAHYDTALDRLLAGGRAFLCGCSRTDVAGAVAAPHDADEDGPRYPGTCRDRDPADVTAAARAAGRLPVVRFRGDSERITFDDEICGVVEPFGQGIDDFVLRRADGVAAYQLAVVVDDALMAVSHVLRGDDLLRSTPRQIALYRALGQPAPRHAHVPLVLAPGGARLAKRSRPVSIADLRQAGAAPEVVIGVLAASAGLLLPGARALPGDLIEDFDLARVPRGPVVIEGLP